LEIFQLILFNHQYKNFSEALNLCDKVIKEDRTENDFLFYSLKAEMLLKLGEFEKAKKIMDTFENLTPVTPEDLFGIGKFYQLKKSAKECLYYWHRAAKLEFPQAMFCIGECYDHGYGVDKNEHMAFEWYQKAAAAGCVSAFSNLGICYLSGLGIEKNIPLAVFNFQEGAHLGNPRCIFNLSLCYEKGIGKPKDQEEGFKLLKEAADLGDTNAQYNISIKLLINDENYHVASSFWRSNDKRIEMAVEYLTKAAKSKHKLALFQLGLCYLDGIGVIRNSETAFKYIKMSAEKKYLPAIKKVAIMLQDGLGHDMNVKESTEWFLEGANEGDFACTVKVVKAYKHGIGVEPNPDQALKWFTRLIQMDSSIKETDISKY